MNTLSGMASMQTSGQRIMTKGRITGERFFDGGQCKMTLTCRGHCSRLQESRCLTVIEDLMIPFAAYTAADSSAFQWARQPQKLPFFSGGYRLLQYIVSWAYVSQSQPQTASRSV